MPDELAVLERCGGRHHSIDPFGVVEGLVDVGGLIVPLPFHVEVVGPLERDGAAAADFFVSHGAGERDLAGHGGAADDGSVELEFADDGCDAADVGVC